MEYENLTMTTLKKQLMSFMFTDDVGRDNAEQCFMLN